jgi:hypothetical protein
MRELQQNQESRRAFLRSTAKTLAAAIGMAALPGFVRAAGSSKARGTAGASTPRTPDSVLYTCYANAETCGLGNQTGKVKYHCKASGCSSYCTSPQSFSTYQESYSFTNPSCI